MTSIDENKKLLAPLLDRLKSDQGGGRHETSSHHVLQQLRESVRQDMEYLFNTRYRRLSTDADRHPHLESSLVNFGLPDISTINLGSSSSRERFCRQVEDAILTFDPRIKSVKVISDSMENPEDPAIRFRMEAKIHANPAPETIVFDSTLNPVHHNINVIEV